MQKKISSKAPKACQKNILKEKEANLPGETTNAFD